MAKVLGNLEINNGNLGIRTSSPTAFLSVASDATSSSDIAHFSNSNNVWKAKFRLDSNSGGELVFRDGSNNAKALISSSGNSYFNSGNVGIGTTSPNGKLHLEGNFEANKALVIKGTLGAGTEHYFRTHGSNSEDLNIYNASTRAIGFNGGNITAHNGYFRTLGGNVVRSEYDSNNYSQLESNASGGVFKAVASGNTNILLRSYGDSYFNGGNVGIGTSSPAERLDVVGKIVAQSSGYVHVRVNQTDSGMIDTGMTSGTSEGFLNIQNTEAGHVATAPEFKVLLNSSEKFRIDSSGNVGIGTTTPDEKLHIVGDLKIDSDIPRIYLADSSHNPDYSIGNVNGSFFVLDDTNSAYRIYVDSAGKVGIGTNLPAALLDVNGTAQMSTGITENVHYVGGSIQHWGDSGTGLYFETDELRFYTGNAEEMRLENDGDLHVDGDVIAYSTTVSDERLKDDIKTIDSACEKVCSLRGVEYTWNSGSRKGQREIGVIAQEVEKVIPEIVREKKLALVDDEVYKTVDYEKLVAVLIEANKELCDRVSKLESKLDGITD